MYEWWGRCVEDGGGWDAPVCAARERGTPAANELADASRSIF